MSIDPGISGSGYALWFGKTLKRFGVFSSRSNSWQQAGHEIAANLHSFAEKELVTRVYCEFPAFFQSAGGQVAARSGALVKLTWFVGFLEALFVTDFTEFELVPVNVWKGQLPKEVVQNRIRKILSPRICARVKSHAWDAIGVGLYVHGRFK